MYRIAINASNLHVGGGVQIAVSFIEELSRCDIIPDDLLILASDEVHKNLIRLDVDFSRFNSYEVFNTYGVSAVWSGLRKRIQGCRIVFTIFGPLYQCPSDAINIMGFAQAWILYPKNETRKSLTFLANIKNRLKFFLQSLLFRRAHRLVVELEHVKEELLARGFLRDERIHVVHNCLNSVYFRPTQWHELPVNICRMHFSVGFVGRDYPNKNTNILPRIKIILKEDHGLDVDFYVTFNSSEWIAKSDLFRNSIINVGVLDITQCPSFYQKMDAIIFPSLLECFSATPLEAMAMKKPLFASDRGFVRDICGDLAFYFDPEDPVSAANLIADYINNMAANDSERLIAARKHVIDFSNSRQRAEEYLKIIQLAKLKEFNPG